MRQFEHPNMTDFECPICKTSKDMPVVLIGIPGTESDGVMKARQVHAECIEWYAKMNDLDIAIEK
jgi:hypothetical protein